MRIKTPNTIVYMPIAQIRPSALTPGAATSSRPKGIETIPLWRRHEPAPELLLPKAAGYQFAAIALSVAGRLAHLFFAKRLLAQQRVR
jgi:hypothetical protein